MPEMTSSEKRQRQLSPERLREEAEKLRTRLAQIEAQAQSHDAQRHSVIGRAVLLHAGSDSAFKAELDRILDATVTEKAHRRLLGLPMRTHGKRGRPPRDTVSAGTGGSSGASPPPGGS